MTELFDFVRRSGLSDWESVSAEEILLRVTVLLSVALLVMLVLQRASAALRHMVLAASLVGALLIPPFSWWLPSWHWAVLPKQQQVEHFSTPAVLPVVEMPPTTRSAMEIEPFDLSTSPMPTSEKALPSVAQSSFSQSAWSWSLFFVMVWAFGALLGLVWLGVGMIGAWWVARRAKPAADSYWNNALQKLRDQSGCRRPVEVRQCPQVSVPMTWGLRRPVILVPTNSDTWSEVAKRSVLLHELGHIRRGDCLVHLLARFACALYWFHPLFWVAARLLRKTSEQAADDMVLSSNIAPPDYAEQLVTIAAQMRGLHLFSHVALPMASPSDLENRVLAILDPNRNHRSLKRKTCYALIGMSILLLIPCAVLRLGYAQDAAKDSANVTDSANAKDSTEKKVSEDAGPAEPGKNDAGATATVPVATTAKDNPSSDPIPVMADTKNSIDSILKRVAEEEKRYDSLEVQSTMSYEFLNPRKESPTGGVTCLNWKMQERSVFAKDRLYHEAEAELNMADGTTQSSVLHEAYDGQCMRAHRVEASSNPDLKLDGWASVGLQRKDDLKILRPHMLLRHDLISNGRCLSDFLSSGDGREQSILMEYMGEERIDALDCYKLLWSPSYNNGRVNSSIVIWLARDRNLLPIRMECHRSGEKHPTSVASVDELRELRPGLWFPVKATILAYQNVMIDSSVNPEALQWRRQITVDEVALDPEVDAKLFSTVEVPKDTTVVALNYDGQRVGEFKQPETGNLEFSLEKLVALWKETEAQEDDHEDPKDQTAPERKEHIDKALKVLRADPPASQEERIEAALKILRHYRMHNTNTKKWALAIRELITIGKPAIPKLIQEIDQTDHLANRGNELRALGFVLRGIGDPRAVPALIRSLPATLQPPYSDCAEIVADRRLMPFMQRYDDSLHKDSYYTNGRGHFNYGRPITEVMSALHELTGVKATIPGEPDDQSREAIYGTFLGGNDHRKQQMFLMFAEKWADWWAKNWASYVNDEKDAQLEQTQKALKKISETLAAESQPKAADASKDKASSLKEDTQPPALKPAKEAERTIALALSWFVRHQEESGKWSLGGFNKQCKGEACSGGAAISSDTEATAMALLPFLAAGQTHQSKGLYQNNISKGIDWLVKQQDAEGDLSGKCIFPMHAHGIATVTLCNAYGMTKDPQLEAAAQKAVDYIERAQNESTGGWRYEPKQSTSDMTEFGWQIMALQSAKCAGLKVSPSVLEKAQQWLESDSKEEHQGLYGSQPYHEVTADCTAVGMFCSERFGVDSKSPAMQESLEYLLKNLPDVKLRNTHYWFYGTLAFQNYGDSERDVWNRQVRRVLMDSQIKEGCAAGSWDPEKPVQDLNDNRGRLVTTSLSTLALETYYRYLPIFLESGEANKAMTGQVMLGVGVNSDSGVVVHATVDEPNSDGDRLPVNWEETRNGTTFRGAGQRVQAEEPEKAGSEKPSSEKPVTTDIALSTSEKTSPPAAAGRQSAAEVKAKREETADDDPVTIVTDWNVIAAKLKMIRDVAASHEKLFTNLRVQGSFGPNNEPFTLVMQDDKFRNDWEGILPNGNRRKCYWLDDGRISITWGGDLLELQPTNGNHRKQMDVVAPRFWLYQMPEQHMFPNPYCQYTVSEYCDGLLRLIQDGLFSQKIARANLLLLLKESAHHVSINIEASDKGIPRVQSSVTLAPDKNYVMTRFWQRGIVDEGPDVCTTDKEIWSEYREISPGVFFLSNGKFWQKYSGSRLKKVGQESEGTTTITIDSVEYGKFDLAPDYFDVHAWPPLKDGTIKEGIKVHDARVQPPQIFIYDQGPFDKNVLERSVDGKQGGAKEKAKETRKAGPEKPVAPTAEKSEPTATGEKPPALLTASGKVLDPNGKPLAGATVYLREWSTYRISSNPAKPQDVNDILATVQTDALGTFQFENIPAKPLYEQWLKEIPWDVVVVAKPYAMAWRHLDAAQQSKPFEITLTPEANISGRVTDEQGQPISNADVKVQFITPLDCDWPCFAYADPNVIDLAQSRLAFSAKTDVDGKVTIAGLPRDVRVSLIVKHPNFCGAMLFVATNDQPQPKIEDTQLIDGKIVKLPHNVYSQTFSTSLKPPLPRLVGRVTAADTKQPLAGVIVEPYCRQGTETDQDGRFVVEGMNDSHLRLIVCGRNGGEYLGRVLFVDVPKDQRETHIDVELERGETLSGVVVDAENGKGVEGVLVGFSNDFDLNTTTVPGPLPTHQKTDPEGRFRLAVPTSKGKVRIFGPVRGYDLPHLSGRPDDIDGFFKDVDVVAGKPTPELKFVAPRMAPEEEKPLVRQATPWQSPQITKAPKTRARTIEGTVVDPDGKPVAGADVGFDQSFRSSDWEPRPVQTDQNGHFSFQVKYRELSEDFLLAIDKQRKLRGHVRLANDAANANVQDAKTAEAGNETTATSPLTIQLVPTGAVKGRVMDGDKPVVGISIQFAELVPIPGSTDGALRCINRDFAKTDEQGQFEFPWVEAGRSFLLRTIIDKGYTDAQCEGQVEAGKTLEVEPFVLMRCDKSVAGVVVDPEGKPVAGAMVSAEMESGRYIPSAYSKRPTGKDGRFAIHGVPDVPLRLTAYMQPPQDGKSHQVHRSANVDANPDQTDVEIVLDPKLASGQKQ
jgi:beta-lactamase regulating signal transducer with metallopeptidase domain/uncharacterized GH25 family protein